MLKNIRFEDYEDISAWSPKHWIRPYNYHILSYYKKYLMIIAMPLFYQTGHAQMAVLIVLQALEIVRFCLTRPFTSRSRNIIRLILELVLLMFFISSLSQ